jgi:DNA polymerase III subunit chi
MATVVFISGVADVLGYAGRLLRKKYREGERVAVYGPAALLARLDKALWESEPLDFTPHRWLRGGGTPPTATELARTPLWLLPAPDPLLHCDSAVNLGADDLDLAASHERVAEIISADPGDLAAGRARWKRYEAQGHGLTHHPQG